jgi:hypothetical protein
MYCPQEARRPDFGKEILFLPLLEHTVFTLKLRSFLAFSTDFESFWPGILISQLLSLLFVAMNFCTLELFLDTVMNSTHSGHILPGLVHCVI